MTVQDPTWIESRNFSMLSCAGSLLFGTVGGAIGNILDGLVCSGSRKYRLIPQSYSEDVVKQRVETLNQIRKENKEIELPSHYFMRQAKQEIIEEIRRGNRGQE